MKSSQLNTSEQPPTASASSPRDNPCLGSDPIFIPFCGVGADGGATARPVLPRP
jgi:hypothetical protein